VLSTHAPSRRLLGAALVGWAALAVMNLIAGPPLGHDEAAFALVARGGADSWLYRSRGVACLAELGLMLGGADWQMRLASAVVGLGVVLAVYAVGRAVFGAVTGAWAAVVIAGAHPMVIRNAELLGDLPATAGVLAGVAVIAAELGRPAGPRWRLVLAAPAFAAALYMRYGSAPVIAIAGLAALALWWRTIAVRPGPVVATAAGFVALLVPHAVYSLHETGTLLGVLTLSAHVPYRPFWGAGLIGYVTANPFAYYGALVAPVMIAAILGLARTVTGRGPWFLAIIGFGQLLAIGLQIHAQPRYVFIAVALMVVLGVEALRPLARPRLALAAAAAAWLGVAIAAIPLDRAIAHSRGAILAAAAAIRADHHAGPCTVIAPKLPQLMWYTRCGGALADTAAALAPASGHDRYLASTPYAPFDGPAFAASHQLTVTELPTGDTRARVWVIR